MIITVTLNAAIDRTLSVPNFRLGRRHRAVEATTMPGGKGVNVARALKLLGEPVIATGFAGGLNGTRILSQLTQEGILNDFVLIKEESRESTAVIDPTSNQQTEINEQGPAIASYELDMFVEKLKYLARGAAYCIFSGSLPRGVHDAVYADLIREIKEMGVVTIVDSEGDPLRLAMKAGPAIVTPNAREAEELVGHEFNDEADYALAVKEMCGMGATEAIMTYSDGCFARLRVNSEMETLKATLKALEPVSTIGSGDAFLAGFAAYRYHDRPVDESLAYAVACGAESTQHFGAGIVDVKGVERLAAQVELQPMGSAEKVELAST